MATVAADIGLAVIACWEAITAIAIGRSGRLLRFRSDLGDYRKDRISHMPRSGYEGKQIGDERA